MPQPACTPKRLLLLMTVAACAVTAGCASDAEDTNSLGSGIVGGKVELGYPDVGTIIFTTRNTFCTAFLVAPRIVMTAAHCVHGRELPDGFFVGPGSPVQKVPRSVAELEGFTRYDVEAIAVHPGYDPKAGDDSPGGAARRYRNDAALVRLVAPIPGAGTFRLDDKPATARPCMAVGYGADRETKDPRGLQKRSATVQAVPGDAHRFSVRRAPTEPAKGDSGSPLFCDGVVTGIYSHYYWTGSAANDSDYYQQVAPLRGWVDTVAASWGIDGPPSPPPPPPPSFKRGEAFDYLKVTRPSQMVATMVAELGYASATAPKAIAINVTGLGFVSIKPGATQEEADRTAEEACFVISGGTPCWRIVSGDTFAIDDVELGVDAGAFRLEKPTGLAHIPFATTAAAQTALAKYGAVGGFKAIAVGLDGTIAFGPTTSTSLAASSEADAKRVALERCEMTSTFSPCTLFAAGSTVVFDGAQPSLAPQIDYSRRTLETNIPGSVAPAFTQYIAREYIPKVQSGSASAIYISRGGSGGFRWGPDAASADRDALAECTRQANATDKSPCFRYAMGLDVLFRASHLQSMGKATKEIHCRSMPRIDCAAHKAIGCTASGSYYTTHSGQIALESCAF